MTTNNKIVHTLALFCVIFFSLIIYLTYIQLFQAEELKTNISNPRLRSSENDILRGSITDKDGVVLAKSTQVNEDTQTREYPFGSLYCHIIGYNSVNYGKLQLELQYDNELLGKSSIGTIEEIKKAFSQNNTEGYNLQLTIDNDLQQIAYDSLGNSKGSVVALEPSTGKVLAMVSKPGFDPNDLEAAFKEHSDSQDGNFTSRSTASVYPPGSTFKVLTSIAGYENNLGDYTIDDQGSTDIDGKLVKNFNSKVLGNIGMEEAMAHSSNVFFSRLGLEIGSSNLLNTEKNALINTEVKFDIPLKKSTLDAEKLKESDTELGAISIGQGTFQVTPLQVAMVAAGVANDGTIMQPYLVSNITDNDNEIIKETESTELSELTTAEIANQVTEDMISVVEYGTATACQINGINVAGKTGTAENEVEGSEHAWFIAFAPADNPKIAIAVLDEYSGNTGGSVCAPIAKKIISTYLNGQ